VPVLYVAGRRISTRAGLWAAALAAFNPAMYYYSQEARAYALLILFSAAAIVLWQRVLEQPEKPRLWLWAGMSILALLTHYFAVFLFVPETIILAKRLGWRRVLTPVGAVVLVGIALVPLALRQRADGKTDWIEAASLTSRIAESAKQFLVGLYGPLEILTAVAAGLLAIGAILLLLAVGEEHERRGARDIAPWAILIAAGLGVARAPRVGTMLGVGLSVLSLAVIVGVNAIPGYQRDDWRSAAHALPARTAGRVIVSQENAMLPLSIYLPALHEARGASVSTRELDFVALRRRRSVGSPLPPVVPTKPPPGFHLVGVHRTESYAVSRFLAPRVTTVQDATLRRASGESTGEVMKQH